MDPFDSQGTAKGRVKHILAKLGTNGRIEATRIAIKRGLVSPGDLSRLGVMRACFLVELVDIMPKSFRATGAPYRTS